MTVVLRYLHVHSVYVYCSRHVYAISHYTIIFVLF